MPIDISTDGSSTFITIGGTAILAVIVVIGSFIGWRRGVRQFLTVAVISMLAYLLLVTGSGGLIDYLNNLFSNLPRLLALLTGNDPVTAGTLGPVLPNNLQLPLAARVFLFVLLVGMALALNGKQPWYAAAPGNTPSQIMGAFAGGLTSLIWANAATAFYQDYVTQAGNPGGLLNATVGVLPDTRTFLPTMIAIFLVVVVVVVVLNLPKALKG